MKNRRTTLRSLHNNKGRNPRGDIYPLGFRFFYLPHPLERDHLAPASLQRFRRLWLRPGGGCFHKAADLLRRAPLHFAGDVGIGVQSEPGAVMAQHTGERLYIHAAGEGHGGEGVPLRYNKDKRKNPVFSRVSAFVVAYSIPFPTLIVNEKSVE